jgi:capsular exopolysaccharide synthesis family protein
MTAFTRSQKVEYRPAEAAHQPASGSGHQRNVLLALWHRRWIVLVVTMVFLAIAIVRLERATPKFLATAKITVEQNVRPIVNSADSDTGGSQSQNFLYTQVEIIKSRKILEAVAAAKVGDQNISDLPTFKSGESANVLGYLRGNLTVTIGRRDDVVSVSVRGPDPSDCAILANQVVDAYSNYVSTQRHSSTKDVLDLLRGEKAKLDQQIQAKRDEKLAFQRKYADMIIGNERINPTLDRLGQLQGELTNAELATINANSEYQATKAMANDPAKIQELLDSRELRGERTELKREMRDMEEKLSSMGANYLPGMPEYTLAQSTIKKLHDEMALEDKGLVEAYVADLEAQYQSASLRQQELQAAYDKQKVEVMNLNTKAAEFAVLNSELEALESFQGDISKKVQDLGVVEDANIPVVNLFEEAKMSEAPQVEPDWATTIFEALVLGLAAGGLLAFLRDWLDQRLRSADEIKQVMQIPILGVVPHIVGARTPSQRGMQLHLEPLSDVAEAYRTIRTGVYFGTPGGAAKTILVTSPAPGDGKTTLASNLAVAMAQAGNRIVLIDADFRKPMQHKIFQLTKGIGMSSVLAGQISLEEAIQETIVPNLSVLPCGPIPANPSEILNSQSFADVLDHLVEAYDHVIIDSPPVLPVTDARILAAGADATILAVRAEKSTRKASVYARDTLAAVGARLLGVVVNDVPRRKGIYGYYYSDSYLYQYGYGNNANKKRGSTTTPKSLSSPGAAVVANGNGASKPSATVDVG